MYGPSVGVRGRANMEYEGRDLTSVEVKGGSAWIVGFKGVRIWCKFKSEFIFRKMKIYYCVKNKFVRDINK